MDPERLTRDRLTRRSLGGVAAAGLGLPLLAACGGGGGEQAASDSDPAPADGPLATTSEIEVGGGEIFSEQKVVVTQPKAGDFKAFSSTCTHQGCPVQSVSDGTINCTCHGSKFSIEDGAPQAGPATSPLPAVQITVQGDDIVLG